MKEETIVQIYNFAERIQPIYKMMNWNWIDGIPTEKDIVNTLKNLIANLAAKDTTYSSTGRLFAEKDEQGIISFGLKDEEYSHEVYPHSN